MLKSGVNPNKTLLRGLKREEWKPTSKGETSRSCPANLYLFVPPFFFLFFPLFSLIPAGSDSKEYACNAADPGSIPGSRRSPGEDNGYLLQYFYLENQSHGQRSLVGTVHRVSKS